MEESENLYTRNDVFAPTLNVQVLVGAASLWAKVWTDICINTDEDHAFSSINGSKHSGQEVLHP